jgi:hypothetical protein
LIKQVFGSCSLAKILPMLFDIDFFYGWLQSFYSKRYSTDSFIYPIGQVLIAKKLMKANITKDFGILVEAKDSCESSATATVLIETQNMVNCVTT